MRNETRLKFNALAAQIAKINGVDSATVKFAVEPSIQQTLENRIQESSAFLQAVNVIGVTEQKGQKLGLGVGSPIAGTTDTTAADRQTKDPTSLDDHTYECTQTNSDTHLTYAKLDAWAKFPDFQTRVRDAIVKRQALDRIMIGFNGTSRAATSNLGTSPLLQDVNIGWLQNYRADAAARVLDGGATADVIHIGGATPDYANLDALVYDAVNSLIEPWYQDDTDLVAICGRQLLADKYFPLLDQSLPSESLAADLIISQKRIGGLGARRAPFFPDNSVFITRLDNLSIYYQDGSRRRHLADNPKRDRVENYESSNEAYVVEDYAAGCLIENIQFG